MNNRISMKTPIYSTLLLLLTAMISCHSSTDKFDASGAFEADEVIIPAETGGILKSFTIHEGMSLEVGQFVGYTDTVQLYLKKEQLMAQIDALRSRKPDIAIQVAALAEQLKVAEKEQARLHKLLQSDAATRKQADDMDGTVAVVKKQLAAQQNMLNTTNTGISKDEQPLHLQLEQVIDQLHRCRIMNPVKGNVLETYIAENEMAAPGKALYRIANLDELILRVYITNDQLGQVKLNQEVNVLTDDGKGAFREGKGVIQFISDKAEFTPKTIQTKNERANMVYAMKVRVKNPEGLYKIGMYGQIRFN